MQLLGVIFTLAILNSCYDSPDLGGLSSELVVSTDVDLDVDFSSYSTYYLSDTIHIVTNSIKRDSIMVSPESDDVINEIEANMNERGYTRSIDPNDIITKTADIAIATNIIRVTNTGQTCYGWWGNYPGYWSPWGWGGGGYYYPYCTTYKYDTGTLILEFGDIKNSNTTDDVKAMWTAAMFGVLSSYDSTNIDRAVNAVEQAFLQSPYIQN